MKKKVFTFVMTICLVSILYADTVSDLLDKAKESYLSNDKHQTLLYLEDAKSEIKKSEIQKSISEIETVEFSRLKNFPSRYFDKKIIVTNTAIDPTKIGEKFNDCYRITVSTCNQKSYFIAEPYESGSLFFIISENLLEKLMDKVPAGYVRYFNVYTDTIYSYIEKDPYRKDYIYYVAKITSLEVLSFNSYDGSSYSTGDYISE